MKKIGLLALMALVFAGHVFAGDSRRVYAALPREVVFVPLSPEDILNLIAGLSAQARDVELPKHVCKNIGELRDFTRAECRKHGAQNAISLELDFEAPGIRIEKDDEANFFIVYLDNLVLFMPSHIVQIVHHRP